MNKLLANLAAALSLVTPSTSQNNIKGPDVTILNIQYGDSCGANTILFWINAPIRGQSVHTIIEYYDGAGPFSVAWIAFGFTKAKSLIGHYNAIPCWLLTYPSWVTPVVLKFGRGQRSLWKTPNDPALKGLPLYAQALHSNPQGFVMSRGVQMSVN